MRCDAAEVADRPDVGVRMPTRSESMCGGVDDTVTDAAVRGPNSELAMATSSLSKLSLLGVSMAWCRMNAADGDGICSAIPDAPIGLPVPVLDVGTAIALSWENTLLRSMLIPSQLKAPRTKMFARFSGQTHE